jgi:hypothetical protein
MKLFSDAYTETRTSLALTTFPTDKAWGKVIKGLRELVQEDGLSKSKKGALDELRSRIVAGSKGAKEAEAIVDGAGKWGTNGAHVDATTAGKLGALKLLRHTYSLTQMWSHKVWIVSTPSALREWPADAYANKSLLTVKTSLNDLAEQFGEEDKKNLRKGTQEGAAWCQKAMIVAGACLKGKGKGIEIIKRWFADEDNQGPTELAAIASTLNSGFKKMAGAMTRGQVILTDVPAIRGDDTNTIWLSEAAAAPGSAATDGIRVVYIESAFFSNRNILTGKKNWTRILVHEMTHVELATADVRYAHDTLGMKPERNNFSTATCLTNAESWAFFAADCAGALDDGVINKVLK